VNRFLRSNLFQRFWAVAGAVSVRTKVLGIVLGTVILLGLFAIVQVRRSMWMILEEEVERQGLAIGTYVAEATSSLLDTSSRQRLNTLLHDAQRHYSDERHNTEVVFIALHNGAGKLLAHSFGVGTLPVEAARLLTSPVDQDQATWYDTESGRILLVSEPFRTPEGREAIARVGLADRGMRASVNRMTRQLLLTLAIMSAVGIAAAVFLTWIITRPIRNLVHATQAVAAGDLSQHVTPWANDEIGRLAESFNRMTDALAQAAAEQAERAQLRAEFVNQVIAAQEEERKRIARELHDSTGQSLSSLLLGLRRLEEAADLESLRERVADLREIVSASLEEVRRMAWELRPSALDDLGLVAALKRYAADYRERNGIEVDLIARGLDGERLPPEVETTVYRIVQEALTNVMRHAQAQNVSVLIDRREGKLLLVIEDDGVGFDPSSLIEGPGQRLGLYGMRERAELLGGKFTVESSEGQGTTLFVDLPLDGAQSEPRIHSISAPNPGA
jgi:signal transduction histidine kinase